MLRREGAWEPLVLAIMAVESFFRPLTWRLAEYALWACLSLIWCEATQYRVQRISVGIAQIQLRTWVQSGNLKSLRFSSSSLRKVLSARANYDACLSVITSRKLLDVELAVVVECYTGGRRAYYSRLLQQSLDHLQLDGT